MDVDVLFAEIKDPALPAVNPEATVAVIATPEGSCEFASTYKLVDAVCPFAEYTLKLPLVVIDGYVLMVTGKYIPKLNSVETTTSPKPYL